ncbi:hypothetical protein D3C80_1606290 [compost metagenome]
MREITEGGQPGIAAGDARQSQQKEPGAPLILRLASGAERKLGAIVDRSPINDYD